MNVGAERSFVETVPALIALAVGWGVAMPALTRLAARLDGFSARPRPAYIRDSWRQVDNRG